MPRNPGGTVSGFKLLSTPDAPTITGVTTSIGSASVAFTAPSDTGDGAITSYVVTAVDESSGVSTGVSGASSPITVSPPAGGTFKIRMQALNPYGPGRLTEYDTGNAIYSGAELYAWGVNGNGRLGDNTSPVFNKSSPVQIGALTTWASISAGKLDHSQAIKTDGTLWTWGDGNDGKTGLGDQVDRSSPTQVGALTNWLSSSATDGNGIAVKTDGTLWTWGNGGQGRLGDNTIVAKSSPIQVGSDTNWSKSAANVNHVLVTKTTGALYAFGYNNQGQIGDNTIIARSSPVQVGALTTWATPFAGELLSLALKIDNTLWVWGWNNNGQLGKNDQFVNRSSPVQIGTSSDWATASGGEDHVIAVKTNGTLWAWGANSNGNLGDGTTSAKSSPVQIGALTTWQNVSASRSGSSVAVKTDGTLWAWGRNNSGQLGDGTVVGKSSPVQIGSAITWVNVSTGQTHVLALYGVV